MWTSTTRCRCRCEPVPAREPPAGPRCCRPARGWGQRLRSWGRAPPGPPRAPRAPLCQPGAPCQREAVPRPHPMGTPWGTPLAAAAARGARAFGPPPGHVLTAPWGRAPPALPCPAPAPLPPRPDNQALEPPATAFHVTALARTKQLGSERGGTRSAQGRAGGSTRAPPVAGGLLALGPAATPRQLPGAGGSPQPRTNKETGLCTLFTSFIVNLTPASQAPPSSRPGSSPCASGRGPARPPPAPLRGCHCPYGGARRSLPPPPAVFRGPRPPPYPLGPPDPSSDPGAGGGPSGATQPPAPPRSGPVAPPSPRSRQ